MSDTTKETRKNLKASQWESAQLYAALMIDTPITEVFGRWDGLDIPPSTRVKSIVVLEHIPDPEDTIELIFNNIDVPDFNPT